MNDAEQKAVLTICLMAAFADGAKDEREREQIKRITGSLAPGAEIDPPEIYQDVLLKRRTLEDTAAEIKGREIRQFAYEMAVCVCAADGAQNEDETAFLARLRAVLDLGAESARAFEAAAAEVADAPLPDGTGPATSSPRVDAAAGAPPAVDTTALDKMILNASILNGALELLPQSLASMAILPLQIKLVYGIGKAYGYELDRGHIKDFAATLGVGLTGQFVEQIGRKLIGGLFRQVGGGLLGGLGRTAVGLAFSFATTYALGQVAKQYYAGGRTLNASQLKEVFASLLERSKSLQTRYAGEVRDKARTIDINRIAGLARLP